MSNLLPEKPLQSLRGEYRARFVFAGASLGIAAAVFTALALSPSFAALYFTRPAAQARATQAQQSITEVAEIGKAQALVVQLKSIAADTDTVSDIIADVLEKRPSGVRVDSVSYGAGTTATISVTGIADNREVMDRYRAQLIEDERFASVKLPVGDLIGSKGGRFTITLSGKF